MTTRTITGPAGPFYIPSSPELRSLHSEVCCMHVFSGEYDYPRDSVEEVLSLVDVGCNVGAFVVWAMRVRWPGQIVRVDAYDPNLSAIHLARRNCEGMPVTFHDSAVSIDPNPLFMEHMDWGGSRTHGETCGVNVPAIHPRDLPAADVLKVDAEGVDPDVFEHYQHWPGVKIALFEYHEEADAPRMEKVCRAAGLVQVRHHGSPPKQGIQVWVRK